MKQALLTLWIIFFLSLYAQAAEPVSIIYMIGDGMGPAYTAAYRYYQAKGQPDVQSLTVFDRLLTGMVGTYPQDDTEVTDSAAAVTALATGHKSRNGYIAVTADKKPVETLLERAKSLGYLTGMVASSEVVHATPAGFVAHYPDRKAYNKLADQFMEQHPSGGLDFDLLFGGGKKYFRRKDKDLWGEFKALGYSRADSWQAFDQLDTLPAVALLAEAGLPYAIDSAASMQNRVERMTAKALCLLGDNKKSFFIMIEGSQIDWCGHDQDIACAMAEMDDFAAAIELAKTFVDDHPNTLLVVTADHSTGGLALGDKLENRVKYQWYTDVIERIKGSVWTIQDTMMHDPLHWEQHWNDLTGIALTKEERQALAERVKEPVCTVEDDPCLLGRLAMDIINARSNTGWTTLGHTAVDVPLFSYGKGSELFRSYLDNTDLADRLFKLLETR